MAQQQQETTTTTAPATTQCRFPYVDQYKRIWPLDVDSLRPGDFIYPNDVVDDIYRPISRKPVMWLAWKEEVMGSNKQELVSVDDHKTTFWLDIVRAEDRKYRKDIMLPTSQVPFQVGAFGGGDGTQNLQVVPVPRDSGCRTTHMAQYVYQWKIPRGIVHEYTYRFRLRVEGKTDLVSQSADFFLNATQRERVIRHSSSSTRGRVLELAPYREHAAEVGRSLPLGRRLGLAVHPWRQTDGLLLLGIFALLALLAATFLVDDGKEARWGRGAGGRRRPSKGKHGYGGGTSLSPAPPELPTAYERGEKT